MGYITVWPGGIRVAQTNTCWRYAVKPEQGIGWTKYTGNWVFPESHVGTIKILDSNNQVSWLVFDARLGRAYILANRNGPAGSGITREFRDRVSDYGGQEISCRILLKEHTGKRDRPLRHEFSQASVRPYDEANKGAAGYQSNGQRSAQQVDINAYTDGELVEFAKAHDVLVTGEVPLDKKTQADRIQIEYVLAASEFKIAKFNQKYLFLDKKGTPSEIITNEQTWQNEFGLPVLWLSRGPNLLMDRAVGSEVSGSILSETSGPDGKSLSAMAFSLLTGLSQSIGNLTGNFSVVFSISSIVATTTVLNCSVGSGRIRIVVAAGVYSLEYRDSSGTYTQQLGWTGSGWVTIAVARTGLTLRIMENGAHLQDLSLAAIITIGGTAQIMPLQSGILFDFRILAAAVSINGFYYYYRDLTQNSGNSLLPMW